MQRAKASGFLLIVLLLAGCATDDPAPFEEEGRERTRDEADVWVERGHNLLKQGDMDGALEAYERARAEAPLSPWSYLAIAALLGDRGRPAEALAVLDELCKRQPKLARGFQARARLRDDQGDKDGSLEDRRAVVSCLPTYALGWQELGEAYLVRGDAARASEALERSVALQPSPAALLLLARTYDASGDVRAPGRWEALLELVAHEKERHAETIREAEEKLAGFRIHIEDKDRDFLLEWSQRLLDRTDFPRERLAEIAPRRLLLPCKRYFILTLLQPNVPPTRAVARGETLLDGLQGAVLRMRASPFYQRYYRSPSEPVTTAIDIQASELVQVPSRVGRMGEIEASGFRIGTDGLLLTCSAGEEISAPFDPLVFGYSDFQSLLHALGRPLGVESRGAAGLEFFRFETLCLLQTPGEPARSLRTGVLDSDLEASSQALVLQAERAGEWLSKQRRLSGGWPLAYNATSGETSGDDVDPSRLPILLAFLAEVGRTTGRDIFGQVVRHTLREGADWSHGEEPWLLLAGSLSADDRTLLGETQDRVLALCAGPARSSRRLLALVCAFAGGERSPTLHRAILEGLAAPSPEGSADPTVLLARARFLEVEPRSEELGRLRDEADVILARQVVPGVSRSSDREGGFRPLSRDEPEAAYSAHCLTALAAAYRVLAPADTGGLVEKRLRRALDRGAVYLLRHQVTSRTSFFAKDPWRSTGGFRRSLSSGTVDISTHAEMGLALLHVLQARRLEADHAR